MAPIRLVVVVVVLVVVVVVVSKTIRDGGRSAVFPMLHGRMLPAPQNTTMSKMERRAETACYLGFCDDSVRQGKIMSVNERVDIIDATLKYSLANVRFMTNRFT